MTELYWITRFDYIQGFLIAFLILVGCVIIVATIGFCADCGSTNESPKSIKVLKWTIPSFAIALSILCFIPSTKEAMMIYGIGGTIDYIKSNDKAKELPDKCIDALTRYVDSIEPEKTNKQ